MDVQTVRRQILNFIRERFTARDFGRAIEIGDNSYFNRFASYTEFLRDQARVLDNVPIANLERYRVAIIDIANNMYILTDLEGFSNWGCDGFILQDGQMVFFHER